MKHSVNLSTLKKNEETGKHYAMLKWYFQKKKKRFTPFG